METMVIGGSLILLIGKLLGFISLSWLTVLTAPLWLTVFAVVAYVVVAIFATVVSVLFED